jgi:putative transcriptional regulator
MTMASKAFKGIMAWMQDALAHSRGEKGRAVLHTVSPVDVKAARERLGLSQGKFSAAFGVSVATVRNWEQGHRQPTGAARILLRVIEKRPKAVLEALDSDD